MSTGHEPVCPVCGLWLMTESGPAPCKCAPMGVPYSEVYSQTVDGTLWRMCSNLRKVATELESRWYTRWLGRRMRRSAEGIWSNRRELWS